MATTIVTLRSISGTEAALGWSGHHSVIVDRPAGVAGGLGLGFNGGQLLGLAIGGCFCNDLRYVAHEMGVALASVSVEVEVEFEGTPLLATSASLQVSIEAEDPAADLAAVLRRAKEGSTVANSLTRGLPVSVSRRIGG
ncbi:OsmC family protein [Roseomonas populi]|uniref:OsmC family protein n=1 Tax=Roseomonas populi TaxID=3121582 RepID=A0ABT1WYT9_9PROT|nr:OsmC family protein [Roseomonas pecuniae]MCR0981015.1 OsmC family protein [Roseomonas pecuniae]